MKDNFKFSAGFTVFGFLLSFCSSLFSGNGFLRGLLFGLLFALVFAGISFLLQLVFEKLLEVDSAASVSAVPTGVPSASAKHLVDIQIENEDLPREENEPSFFVGNNYNMLRDSDMQENEATSFSNVDDEKTTVQKVEKSVQEEPDVVSATQASSSMQDDIAKQNSSSAASASFVPVSLGVPVNNAENTAQAVKQNVENEKSVVADEELDVLPDLESIKTGASFISSSKSEDVDDEDEVESPGSSFASSSGKDANEIAEGQDAALMAKAISSMLASEK